MVGTVYGHFMNIAVHLLPFNSNETKHSVSWWHFKVDHHYSPFMLLFDFVLLWNSKCDVLRNISCHSFPYSENEK